MTSLTTATRRWGTGLIALAAGLGMALTAAPASAETINVDYDVNGVTQIEKTGSSITLGPAVMHSRVEDDGSFTGDMELPGTRTEFKVIGFIPVTADVNFTPTGPTTGQLTRVGRQRTLASTSSYYVRLSNIKASVFPLFAGQNCRTVDPVVIPANTPEGEFFDIAAGGRLVGEYSIGDFQNCGLNTWLINLLVPGGGNTVELNLTNGRIAN
ncbi:hypothetical protein EHW97_14935 [Aeromicrobium camelliae]|uniref:Secreted protein n=1 Tax=Aeromicrobium camelliae TaxID=1538144 RepID=A0A3N6W386_9ACTN|nr:hypothetical protein [Aeromicrobium camelliae]RQN01986.1 hypothetical protein EHW97_14935 [Aeromicrobium camelliae]